MKRFQISYNGKVDDISAETFDVVDDQIRFRTGDKLVGVVIIAPGMVIKEL